MRVCIRILYIAIVTVRLFISADSIHAENYKNTSETAKDSLSRARGFIHAMGIEVRLGYIFPTNTFLDGENYAWKPIRNTFSGHLKYAFRFHPESYTNAIYRGVYQGVGLAFYTFGNRRELGDPIAFYLFQGAEIARIHSFLSFNYEWNFGASAGWKPYDFDKNYYNKVIGSKINAYLNANFYLNWELSPHVDLTTGFALAHFSNGNTKFPNAGLNTISFKMGIAYHFNREKGAVTNVFNRPVIPEFPRHISYDLVLFGSWRRKGVVFGDKQIPSPYAYPVLGFNFAPMYNLNYKLRVGASLDGVYDGSANMYTQDYIVGTRQQFFKPGLHKQLALGISGRAEYIMPYFSIGMGLGTNLIHGGGDLKAFYQILALKIELTRSSFLHIGYSLSDFHDPNYLMLGIGYRFNNIFPVFHR